jgi:hypothetical protein
MTWEIPSRAGSMNSPTDALPYRGISLSLALVPD